MTDATASPLAEASPSSLDEYFSRNPRSMSDEDLRVIVKELRRQRERWKVAEAAGAVRAPKAPKTKQAVSLADLGLE
jgi:hypothetical protein